MVTIDVLFVQLVQTGVLAMQCKPEIALHLVAAANDAVPRIPSDMDIADAALEFVVDAMLKDGWWGHAVWVQITQLDSSTPEVANDTAAVDEEDDSQEADAEDAKLSEYLQKAREEVRGWSPESKAVARRIFGIGDDAQSTLNKESESTGSAERTREREDA